jgi:signal transduction histidine kinase
MRLSLKAQVTLFLLIFILILLSQVLFAKLNQGQLIGAFSNYQEIITEEKLVRELERDILDLQRQVLIFKDTGSDSAVKRFNTLFVGVEIDNTSFCLTQLFDSLTAFSVSPAAEKKLNVEILIEPTLPIQAIGDPLRISQVILNLTNNAIKFTHSGTISISFLRKESTELGICFLEVQLKDTGVGKEESRLTWIFTPFTQGDNSISREYGGTGLGLSIVKQLTSLMHGEVKATSTLGLG